MNGYVCNEHGEGVEVIFSVAFGPGGCPVCVMQKKLEQLEDWEEGWDED